MFTILALILARDKPASSRGERLQMDVRYMRLIVLIRVETNTVLGRERERERERYRAEMQLTRCSV